jgi:hypothetical protein
MHKLAITLTVLGIVLILVYEGLVLSHTPQQFYPVNYYRANLTVNSTSVTVHREGDPDKVYPVDPSAGITSSYDVSSEVQVERPIPLRAGRKGAWQGYNRNLRQPSDAEILAAGPEKVIVVKLSASKTLPAPGDPANFDLTFFVWPNSEMGSFAGVSTKLLPDPVVKVALPALAEDALDQSGDKVVADGVRAGGTTRPELPYSRRLPEYEWPILAIGVLLLFASLVMLKMRRPPNAINSHDGAVSGP